MMGRHIPTEGTAPWERPAPADRAARSEAIERRIQDAAARISDAGLRRLLEGTLSNTLDTTIVAVSGTDERPDAFVVTGDIDAMWLRDSTAQVWPYLTSVRDDAGLDRLIRGVIHRQSDQILLDPYANAFLSDDQPGEWAGDETDMRPGVHERKWEPDSLLAFCRLSAGYWRASRSLRPFDGAWRGALGSVLRTLRTEQRLDGASPYRFHRPDGDPTDFVPNNGLGAPSRPNGMVHGAFRPSDDASDLPLNVPINLALAAALDAVAPLAAAVDEPLRAAEARTLAQRVKQICLDRSRQVEANGGRADYWLAATLAEAELIGGRYAEAEVAYRVAAQLGQGNWRELCSTRRQVRLLAAPLGLTSGFVDRLFPMISIAVFAAPALAKLAAEGKMREWEQRQKAELKQRLAEAGVVCGYATALSPADLLFIETMLELSLIHI